MSRTLKFHYNLKRISGNKFYCFTMHLNSLNVTHQLMHFQYNNILVQNVNFKTIKNTPTCFDLNRSSSGSSSLKSLNFKKITEFKILKSQSWLCGSITFIMCP